MVLDIRTGDLSDIKIVRFLKNGEITLFTFLYRRVSVISESLAGKLSIPKRKTIILPLGGELQEIPGKNFDSLKLLYVGTLDNRNIHDTVYGLSAYLKQHPSGKISYDIIGTGSRYWLNLLNKSIVDTDLNSTVCLHGSKSLSEVIPFFEMCNIGIVYVPQRDYYQFQPSTKLYESLLAGMPVIATNTYENKIALKQECGVLTDDNPVSFCNALEQIKAKKHLYASDKIKKLYHDSCWDYIVKDKLEKYIDNCCE
jgi:glycosyltransferase involved in cell wall biosynthesis